LRRGAGSGRALCSTCDKAGEGSEQWGARPPGASAKTGEVQQKILDACVEAFSAGGFHGATMEDIAEQVGISQAGLLHHFGSKAELLAEVLAAHERETAAIAREADDLDLLRTHLQVAHANEACPGLIQLHSIISSEAMTGEHPTHELHRARYDSLRLHLTRVFAELRGRGRLKVDTRLDSWRTCSSQSSTDSSASGCTTRARWT
jgi:AcrR family transcriptional regulator